MDKMIASPSVTKEILKKYDVKLIKKMGQNMLIDQNILDIILQAANIKEKDLVIEIGCGIGSLTQKILQELDQLKEGFLLGIEKDTRMVKILTDYFGDHEKMVIINRDILSIEWEEFIRKQKKQKKINTVKVVANLPYYITTPVIMSLLESNVFFSRMVFMIQREVAERIIAKPGTKEFGSLSVAVQFHGKAEIIHHVSPEVFLPRPEVNSSIIQINPFQENPFDVKNKKFFFRVVKAIFQQRRKTLKNSLLKSSVFALEKEIIVEAIKNCNLNTSIRGEKLSIEKMVELSNCLYKVDRERSDIS